MKVNPYDPQTYLEYRVEFELKGNIVQYKDDVPVFSLKVPTSRKSVRISERDARINNLQVEQTRKWYELAEEPKEEKPKAMKPKAEK